MSGTATNRSGANREAQNAPSSSLHPIVGPQLGDIEYWRSEVMRLRQMWGTQSFWLEPERASRALQGLLYVWAQTNNPSASDGVMMESAALEFDRRLLHALLRPNEKDQQ